MATRSSLLAQRIAWTGVWWAIAIGLQSWTLLKRFSTHTTHWRILPILTLRSLQCCLVTKSYASLCDPMDCSTPGFPVLHCLSEFA